MPAGLGADDPAVQDVTRGAHSHARLLSPPLCPPRGPRLSSSTPIYSLQINKENPIVFLLKRSSSLGFTTNNEIASILTFFFLNKINADRLISPKLCNISRYF